MRDTTAQDERTYPGSVEWVYARLRRHPWLVDGTLAAVLLVGSANAYLGRPAVLPASLALAGAVLVRRRFPVAAYAVALAIGTAQVIFAPAPAADEIEELVTQAREAGMQVSQTVEGSVRLLPGGLSLAAYRIVQEALTNVRKHAGPGASAEVTLCYAPDELLIRVTDDGRGTAGLPRYGTVPTAEPVGHGLAGMRERAAMYGGTVQAGPRAGRGFEVTARLPLPAPSKPPARKPPVGTTSRRTA